MADKKLFVPVKIGNVSVHLWTVLLFCVSLFFDFFEMLVISYCIVALHEMSHIWAFAAAMPAAPAPIMRMSQFSMLCILQ